MKILGLVGVGVVAACTHQPSSPPSEPSGPVGALLVTAELDDPSIARVAYAITAPDLGSPVAGELTVEAGVAQGQLSIPAGELRMLEVSYLAAGGEVCRARARDLSIEAGRTAQVLVVPACSAGGSDRKKNSPPRIEAVLATRRSVDVGELVSLAVIATDPDDDNLSYRWTENVAGFGFDRPTSLLTRWKAGPRAVAHNRVKIKVSDGRGGTATRTLTMDFDGLALGPGTCAQPTKIKIGQELRGFTRGTSAHGSGLCSIPEDIAPEHVFRLDIPTRQDVSIALTGSAFFARAYVRRDACATGPELACDGGSQRIDLPQADPGTYYIVVDGDSVFSQGEFRLTVFSGTQPEVCRNFGDDDGDGAIDCDDSDCTFEPGCLVCSFECDPNPNDCIGGQCDPFFGHCNTFVRFGEPCDRDANPATIDVCNDVAQCVESTAVCGNGQPEQGEQCDDGNTTAGDGCSPTCQVELCGTVSCDDGNVCTVDVCTDSTASTCEQTPLTGTACELDGSIETPDTCQAGVCTAPPTDDALIILDPAVLSHPAFSLAAMHDRLAPNGDGAALFEQWATTLTAPMTTNDRTVDGRSGWATFLAGLPRNAAGKIDVDAAGFLPSAMVNRFDLRTPGNCGEHRLVFTKTSAVTDAADRATLIFEFDVPMPASGTCQDALAPWLALRTSTNKAADAAALLVAFAQPSRLGQFRTNEFVNAPFWELREFHLVNGELVPFPVVDSVPFELAQDATFRQFVVQNASTLNHGAREIGVIPTTFLAPASRADGQSLFLGNIVPSLPGLEANINVLSCSGCHLTHTGTSFVHIAERPADQPSALSIFMRSELAFRSADLGAFLAMPALHATTPAWLRRTAPTRRAH